MSDILRVTEDSNPEEIENSISKKKPLVVYVVGSGGAGKLSACKLLSDMQNHGVPILVGGDESITDSEIIEIVNNSKESPRQHSTFKEEFIIENNRIDIPEIFIKSDIKDKLNSENDKNRRKHFNRNQRGKFNRR